MIIIIAIITVVISILLYKNTNLWIPKLRQYKINHPPLIERDPALEPVSTLLKSRPTEFLVNCRKENGNIFSLKMEKGTLTTFVFDPHSFHTILRKFDFTTVSKQSKQRFAWNELMDHIDEVTIEAKKAFRGQYLSGWMHRFSANLKSRMDTALSETSDTHGIMLNDYITGTILPSLLEALFDKDLYYDDFVADFNSFNEAMSTRFADSDSNLKCGGEKAMEKLTCAVKRALSSASDGSIVSYFRAGFLKNLDIDAEEEARFFVLIMWASIVNLMPTHFWMICHIAKDLHAAEIIRSEIVGSPAAVTSSQLRAMKKTDAIMKEVLRLHSRPHIYRVALKDTDINVDGKDYTIPQKSWIGLFPAITHMDPDIFEHPTVFKHDRFVNDDGESTQFTKGGRALANPLLVFGTCPARSYTYYVLKIVAISMFGHFDIEIVDEIPKGAYTIAATPPPINDVRAILKKRRLGHNAF